MGDVPDYFVVDLGVAVDKYVAKGDDAGVCGDRFGVGRGVVCESIHCFADDGEKALYGQTGVDVLCLVVEGFVGEDGLNEVRVVNDVFGEGFGFRIHKWRSWSRLEIYGNTDFLWRGPRPSRFGGRRVAGGLLGARSRHRLCRGRGRDGNRLGSRCRFFRG